jgi:translation initiation factor 1 (eIF-1/SUI1)
MKNSLKFIKKNLCCNGSMKKNKESEEQETFLQFQGDHRDKIKTILVDRYHIQEDSIKIHGF